MNSNSEQRAVEISEPEWHAQEEAWLLERVVAPIDHGSGRVRRYRFIVRQLCRPLNVSAPPSFARLVSDAVEAEMRARARLMGRFEITALGGLAVLCGAAAVCSELITASAWIDAERVVRALLGVAGNQWVLALAASVGLSLAIDRLRMTTR
jgi:hypothetical protein